MNQISIKKIEICDVIGVRAYGALATELKSEINKILSTNNKPILLVLNFLGLNPLTYEFIEIALKDVVDYNQKNNDLLVLYKIGKYEFSELITGIIDMLELQSQNNNSLPEAELLSKHYFLVHQEEDGDIQYLADLNSVEQDILKIIVEQGQTTHNEIDEYLKSHDKSNYCEEITKSVERLFNLGFIFLHKDAEEAPTQYYSIKYLQENEN